MITLSPFFIFLLVSAWSADALVQLRRNVSIPAVFVFGDSTVDTGNNNNLITLAKSNFPPYGRDFMGGIATGRFSNGKLPSDLIVEELGIKELLPAYLDPNLKLNNFPTGVNFASSASGFDPLTSKLLLELFKEYIGKLKMYVGENRTTTILSNSLFLVSTGTDDIANTYFHTPMRIWKYNTYAYTDLLVSYASAFLQELFAVGARRIGIISAPPIGCLPSQRTLGGGIERKCVEKYNQVAKLFNRKLMAELERLDNNNVVQARVAYMDAYNPLMDIFENHEKYGFEVANRGCCGTGLFESAFLCNRWSPFTCKNVSRYVFWDSYHPTETTYKIIVPPLIHKCINSLFGSHSSY
ncbi:GDSL esterase/lipase At5g42170-like isoform X2 [Ziziphus jujuba]|uniref:GDSL esterase/lipase At5g42170-like isoform X2 n=1 Tax=Ziziphus jujuba TaxID=326968 RepID=A0A6P6FQR8_ZIZJJ|nr:GDSL esterase/lipase At5g42170-like isoform X2 [Ziziphus jujuba]XP_048330236.1 GDSL esterase/lipase At5g42170-like isoform X2 [Ziziphus jujuba var. spinosa]